MVKLSIEHLSKRYWFEREDREVLAVSDVSLAVEDGEFLAIVGPRRYRCQRSCRSARKRPCRRHYADRARLFQAGRRRV